MTQARQGTGPDAAIPASTRLGLRDVLGLGFVGVRTRKLRAALSALGISIGIATIVIVTGIPASSQKALLQELSDLGTNTLQVEPIPGQNPPLTLPAEAPEMAARIGPVTITSAVANTHAVVRRNDRTDPQDSLGLSVLASSANLLQATNGQVDAGRFLDARDSGLPVVVLGAVAARRLGMLPDTSHDPSADASLQVDIGDHWFTVIGVLDPIPLSPDLDRAVLVDWDAARTYLRFDGHPTVLYLQAAEDQVEAVQGVLPATVDPASPGDVLVTRPADALAAKRATQSSFSALFLGLAAVALLVGGIGVANTMVISVLERRSEIGLRRALGASRGQIRIQFLTESLVLSAMGGAVGTLLGCATTFGYAAYRGWPPVLPLTTAVVGLASAVVVGLAAGVYPSIRAARQPPADALSAA